MSFALKQGIIIYIYICCILVIDLGHSITVFPYAADFEVIKLFTDHRRPKCFEMNTYEVVIISRQIEWRHNYNFYHLHYNASFVTVLANPVFFPDEPTSYTTNIIWFVDVNIEWIIWFVINCLVSVRLALSTNRFKPPKLWI